MRIFSILLLLVIIFGAAAFVFAEDSNFYTHGFVGTNYIQLRPVEKTKIKFEPGIVAGGAVGYKFASCRSELELSYRHNNFVENVPFGPNIFLDSGRVDKISCFANVLYDIPYGIGVPYFHSYIGGGIGIKQDYENCEIAFYDYWDGFYYEEYKYKNIDVTFQVIIGLGMPFSPKTCTKIEYRFLKDEERVYNHAVLVDLMVNF